MVKGLDMFRDRFAGFEDCYSLIGGAACDLWLGEQGLEFRSTKDLDIVLVFDGERPKFVERVWEFIKEGEYDGYHAGETPSNFYRFQKPKRFGFPAKVEICARRPIGAPSHLKVIRVPSGGRASSLSAILLDSDYYDLVRKNGISINRVPTVTGACLIPLKAKAWLNLSKSKASGANVDQRDIDKHRSDVFRLLMSLAPDDRIELSAAIREDLLEFIARLPEESPDWKKIRASLESNNLRLPAPADVVRLFREFHGLDFG